ncbi:MAG: DUF763 domain-containing protein [Patescibacteria group bacterium]|nr:DUF763 domain-containing protein [Patescibacteria group bacterium]
MRTGIANLPLHWGLMPSWLFARMKKLARAIIEAMILEFGQKEILFRLADPYWFQSFGCLLGFDWHSSGLSTTVCGAIKEALRGTEKSFGLFVVGGKGKTSRKAPSEIEEYGEKFSLKFVPKLIYASKMSAKIDNSCLQDGFQIYHHTFIFTKQGDWAVIQQGMNPEIQMARRYHWLSLNSSNFNFVNEPHSAVCCDFKTKPLNLVAKESEKTRKISTEIVRAPFQNFLKDFKKIRVLNMPKYHWIPLKPEGEKRMIKNLFIAHEKQPKNYEELVSYQGIGPKTLRALALISELIYGAKPSFHDPVRYSFAHGGKDGTPYPVNKKQYDQSISILERALCRAKISNLDKTKTLKILYGRPKILSSFR